MICALYDICCRFGHLRFTNRPCCTKNTVWASLLVDYRFPSPGNQFCVLFVAVIEHRDFIYRFDSVFCLNLKKSNCNLVGPLHHSCCIHLILAIIWHYVYYFICWFNQGSRIRVLYPYWVYVQKSWLSTFKCLSLYLSIIFQYIVSI